MNRDSEKKVVFIAAYPHGIGQATRTANFARAVQQLGYNVTVILGNNVGKKQIFCGIENVRCLSPEYTLVGDRDPDSVVNAIGRAAPSKEQLWRAASEETTRCCEIIQICTRLKPAAIVVDSHPFLRQKMAATIMLLRQASRLGGWETKFVSSIRDLVGWGSLEEGPDGITLQPVTPRNLEHSSTYEQLRYYDGVFIHGCGTIPFDFDTASMKLHVTYTGYVVGQLPGRQEIPTDQRHVLVAVGDGSSGQQVLEHALDAWKHCPSLQQLTWHVIAGLRATDETLSHLALKAESLAPNVVRDFDLDNPVPIDGLARSQIIISRHRGDFATLAANACIGVIGAGYNTVAESLTTRTPIIAVPMFGRDGDTPVFHPEQELRARLMAGEGWLSTPDSHQLRDPREFAHMMECRASQGALLARGFNSNGAVTSAQALQQLVH